MDARPQPAAPAEFQRAAIAPEDFPPGGEAGGNAAVQTDVDCPLCGYNLRGLTEPRCPECGYRFQWRDLLDPDRKAHPYLFEHHPRRNVWSFWRTLAAGLRPWKFWLLLRPDQPSRPRRLLAYWLLVALATNLALHLMTAAAWVSETARYNAGVSRSAQIAASWRSRGGLPYPVPPARSYWDFSTLREVAEDVTPALLGWWAMALAWPWLTLGVLMIFQSSMRRARVRTMHVLRGVLYSSDVMLWVALGAAALAWAWAGETIAGVRVLPGSLTDGNRAAAVAWMALAFTAAGVAKLWAAYRNYLKFDHALATVIATQIILRLAGVVVALNVLVSV